VPDAEGSFLTAEHYHALHSWMDAHPTAKRCVVALDRWLPLIPFVCYPVLLCLLNVRLFRLLGSRRQAALDLTAVIARTVFVPGLTFWGGTILRDRLNLPRPYEQPGFEPLRHKETRGHSFPSRHALSASVLAMVWMYFYPKAGWVMVGITVLICVGRVLTGVHHIRDVVGGAALGFALGFAGMWLL
jgi:membrane-associated phospholipid phosphatase